MLTRSKIKFNWLLAGYVLLLLAYAVFSYALTAPNLILSSWPPYWQFQTWMWTHFFNNRQLLSIAYVSIMVPILGLYLLLVKNWPKKVAPAWKVALIATLPLMLTNNALSYDVFNYIFNAKMVMVYHANPHVKVALDYAYDDWTRFMHNTHTPAPYFYGWTGLSLLPYLAGFGKFLPTWMSFRLFAGWSFLLLVYLLTRFTNKDDQGWLAAVLLSPLLLIEVIGNMHNDLWMMAPAIWSLILITHKKSPAKTSWSLLLLLFSASIKLATLALLPLWFGLVLPLKKWPHISSWFNKNWALAASTLMFLPLLTPRSKQFLPWYLIWSLVWIPLIKKQRAWKISLIVLSLSSMLRYLPYFWVREYTTQVTNWQLAITWVPFLIYWYYRWRKQAD